MLRYGRLPQPKRVGDLADRSLLPGDELENVPAARFGDGIERIRGRCGAGHETIYTFPYWNMSSRGMQNARSGRAGRSNAGRTASRSGLLGFRAMLQMLRDLVDHKGHANAALLNAIRQNAAAAADPELRELLHHVLLANRFWLLAVLGLPFVLEDESRPADSLTRSFSDTHVLRRRRSRGSPPPTRPTSNGR